MIRKNHAPVPMRTLTLLLSCMAAASLAAAPADLDQEIRFVLRNANPFSLAAPLFHSESPKIDEEMYLRAKQLPAAAVPICLDIMRDRAGESDQMRAAALGLLGLLENRGDINPAVSANIHNAILDVLYREPQLTSMVSNVGLGYVQRYGKKQDYVVLVRFLDHPYLGSLARSIIKALISRDFPGADPDQLIASGREKLRLREQPSAKETQLGIAGDPTTPKPFVSDLPTEKETVSTVDYRMGLAVGVVVLVLGTLPVIIRKARRPV